MAMSSVLEAGGPRVQGQAPYQVGGPGHAPSSPSQRLICEGTGTADFTGDYGDEVKQAHQRAMSSPVLGAQTMGAS